MYKNFFGFKERPFKLVPDPAYLFLSRSHEVALAYLVYAVTQGDGFVAITGEIGTGKTTLCRSFLDSLDEKTKAAYIFNPKLNSVQLLKAINDEFGISSESENTKDLIDGLNAFLIVEKAKGTNIILLIDEAQNLSKAVLEQLRLISNLETSRHKLIQIILVGQPELGETLDSHDLRQLAQRITLRSQLVPLSYKELTQYIQHRLHIASPKHNIKFTHPAYRAIYKYSQGIPRLINIVCDRALIMAFVLEQKTINTKIVKAAVRELSGQSHFKQPLFYQKKNAVIGLIILCIALLIGFFYQSKFLNVADISKSLENEKIERPQTKIFKIPASAAPEPEIKLFGNEGGYKEKKQLQPHIEATGAMQPMSSRTEYSKPYQQFRPGQVADKDFTFDAEPSNKKNQELVMESVGSLSHLLEVMDNVSSRRLALNAALGLWDASSAIKSSYDRISDDQSFFRLAAKDNGLLIRRIEGNLKALTKLNLPAVLSFSLPKASPPVYLTLSKINDNKITLKGGKDNDNIELESSQLRPFWKGVAFILWKNFMAIEGIIPLDSPKDSIITLKSLMKDIGFGDIEINPIYDEVTRRAVTDIQKKYGLHVDGVVGSTTKIALYNEKYFSKIPHITE
ncbi:MAG: AAA family ATPase [Desulfobacterales bacterium]|nr:MAG: AAA family ATPase [Desulfobacterales bacterium]